LKKNRVVPELTSGERRDVYLRIFLLNRSFHSIVQRLDELKQFLSSQDLRDMRGLAQEVQMEINTLLLERLSSIEDNDWAHFGKVRTALEKRLKEPPGKRKR
jgi:hypothetical protein